MNRLGSDRCAAEIPCQPDTSYRIWHLSPTRVKANDLRTTVNGSHLPTATVCFATPKHCCDLNGGTSDVHHFHSLVISVGYTYGFYNSWSKCTSISPRLTVQRNIRPSRNPHRVCTYQPFIPVAPTISTSMHKFMISPVAFVFWFRRRRRPPPRIRTTVEKSMFSPVRS